MLLQLRSVHLLHFALFVHFLFCMCCASCKAAERGFFSAQVLLLLARCWSAALSGQLACMVLSPYMYRSRARS